MSLRLKLLAASNALGWLVAVPLLLAAQLSPIVGFDDWQDRRTGERAGAVRLADAPRRAPARVTAAPERRPPGGRDHPAHARPRRDAGRGTEPRGLTTPRDGAPRRQA